MKKTAGYIGLDVGSSGCKAAVLDQKEIFLPKREENTALNIRQREE